MTKQSNLIQRIHNSGYRSFLYEIESREIYQSDDVEFIDGTGGKEWSQYDENCLVDFDDKGSKVKGYIDQIRKNNKVTWFDLREPNKDISWIDKKKYLECLLKKNLEKKSSNLMFSSKWLSDYFMSIPNVVVYNTSQGGLLTIQYANMSKILSMHTIEKLDEHMKSEILRNRTKTHFINSKDGEEGLKKALSTLNVVGLTVNYIDDGTRQWLKDN